MRWIFDFTCFALFYLKEVLVANLNIAMDILRPKSTASPGFIVLPLGEMSDLQILLVTNLISMTPGTLSFDLSQDRTRLLIHAMYLNNGADETRDHLLNRYVAPVRRLF